MVRPPRVLTVPFPLGYPLGQPLDAALQRSVLLQMLDLLACEVDISAPLCREFVSPLHSTEVPT